MRHEVSVVPFGHVSDAAGAAVTANVELQVLAASHELVSVHVTVLEPPQKLGAVAVVLLLELLHPPLFDA